MTTTQGPYTTNYGTQGENPASTTPVGTYVGGMASTADPSTGPAPTTAGPHRSDMANKLDPRVDSDLNNRAQYAPGTTMQDSTTGNMTTKTTNQAGAGAPRAPTDTSNNLPPHASSTGAPGAPGVADNRSQYDPKQTQYNAATGAGYTTQTGYDNPASSNAGPHSSNVANKADPRVDSDQDNRAQNTLDPKTAPVSKSTGASEGIAQGIRSAAAGIHGAGESLRGALNAAVDKTFGHNEGAARNEEIARKGENEIQTGDFSRDGNRR